MQQKTGLEGDPLFKTIAAHHGPRSGVMSVVGLISGNPGAVLVTISGQR